MKAFFSMSLLIALATAQSLAYAQTTSEAAMKPVVKTSCKDYLEMDETIKPKFIYFTAGYSRRGMSTSPTFDVVGVDTVKPVLDEYCRVHLTASTYKKVMEESMASEKKNK
jgi:acid stress chaperone HdeA